MLIANPIYDVVFKYLMDDKKIARLIISKIIGENIVHLDFQPQENVVSIASKSVLVYRLDFAARIKTDDGTVKQVIIEIQKAKFPSDILRFRKYLGEQYASEKNIVEEPAVEYETKAKKAIPIITIYFLGHKLNHTNAPVIKVSRTYIDLATGKEISKKEEFIESLTHDSYIIQIPFLRKNRRNDLEKMLSIFDQDQRMDDNHILNVDEADFPLKYRNIIRRLQSAVVEKQIRASMQIEDEIVTELERMERHIAKLEDYVVMKDDELKMKHKELEVKDKELEVKDQELEIKSRMIQDLMNQIKNPG